MALSNIGDSTGLHKIFGALTEELDRENDLADVRKCELIGAALV